MNHELTALLELLADLMAEKVSSERDALSRLKQYGQCRGDEESTHLCDGVGKSGPFPMVPSDSHADCRLGITNAQNSDQKMEFTDESD